MKAMRRPSRGVTGKIMCAFAFQHYVAPFSSLFAFATSLSHHRPVFLQKSAKFERIKALRRSGRGGTGKLIRAFALQQQLALFSSFSALVTSLSHSTVLFYTKNQRNLSRLWAGAGQRWARLEN